MQPFRRHFRRGLTPVGLLAVVLLAGCSEKAPQDTFEPESPIAKDIYRMITPVFIIAGVVLLLVYGLIAFCVVKFRRKSEDDVPVQVHGSAKLELAWTIVPALLMVGTGIVSVGKIIDISHEPKGAYEIDVIGHQWWWEYRYPMPGKTTIEAGDPVVVTANELHLPVGQVVRANITSEDVMHNFWVPKVAGKIYAIPGRINKLTLEAPAAKEYFGQCAEFCGTSHANMRFRVIGQEQADFDSWLAGQAAAAKVPAEKSAAGEGKKLFDGTAGCTACHVTDSKKVNDETIIGPNLAHVGARATFAGATEQFDTRSLTAWLRNTRDIKPGSRMIRCGEDTTERCYPPLSDEDIAKLVAYLESLK